MIIRLAIFLMVISASILPNMALPSRASTRHPKVFSAFELSRMTLTHLSVSVGPENVPGTSMQKEAFAKLGCEREYGHCQLD